MNLFRLFPRHWGMYIDYFYCVFVISSFYQTFSLFARPSYGLNNSAETEKMTIVYNGKVFDFDLSALKVCLSVSYVFNPISFAFFTSIHHSEFTGAQYSENCCWGKTLKICWIYGDRSFTDFVWTRSFRKLVLSTHFSFENYYYHIFYKILVSFFWNVDLDLPMARRKTLLGFLDKRKGRWCDVAS